MKKLRLLAGAAVCFGVLSVEMNALPRDTLPALFVLPMGAGLVIISMGVGLALGAGALSASAVERVWNWLATDRPPKVRPVLAAAVTPEQWKACSDAADTAVRQFREGQPVAAKCPICGRTIEVAYAARPQLFVVACACGACRRECAAP